MYQDAAMDWGGWAGWGVGWERMGYGIGVGRVRRRSTMAISKSGSVANKLSHRRLPLPFVTGFVVLQPSGVELVFFPCRDVVEGPAVAGSLQWAHDPTIGCVVFEWTPE
jgi:hypothetical protein